MANDSTDVLKKAVVKSSLTTANWKDISSYILVRSLISAKYAASVSAWTSTWERTCAPTQAKSLTCAAFRTVTKDSLSLLTWPPMKRPTTCGKATKIERTWIISSMRMASEDLASSSWRTSSSWNTADQRAPSHRNSRSLKKWRWMSIKPNKKRNNFDN